MSRPYLLHGSRHAKTGSDPIPALGDKPFIAGYANSLSVLSDASTSSIFELTDLDAWTTSDSSVFGSHSGDVSIEVPGFYTMGVVTRLEVASFAAGSVAQIVMNMGGATAFNGIVEEAQFVAGLPGDAAYPKGFAQFNIPSGDEPYFSPFTLRQNSGVTATVWLSFWIVQESATPTSTQT